MDSEYLHSEKSGLATNEPPGPLSPSIRSLISLLLLLHLFVVAIALSSNFAPSQLQARLLSFFSPYAQRLNLDLNFTPYQLTHASLDDVDQRIEVLPVEAASDSKDQWVTTRRGSRMGERYKRYQRLAHAAAFFATRQDSDTAGLLVRDVASYSLHQDGVTPKQVRIRQHLLQGMDAIRGGTESERDPNSDRYFREAYRANVIVQGDGTVEIIKVEDKGQAASPTSP